MGQCGGGEVVMKDQWKGYQILMIVWILQRYLIDIVAPVNQILNMYNLDHSLNLNFSRFNSVNWNNINDDLSLDASTINRAQNQHSNLLFVMPNQPPRPANSIYSCIESQPSENQEIKEVSYLANQGQAKAVKRVNEKQYFRIMKRRVKKGWERISKGVDPQTVKEQKTKKKYLHESRHKHALSRPRGKDGKFLATRPEEQRFREKKKRGRKPKKEKIQNEDQTKQKC